MTRRKSDSSADLIGVIRLVAIIGSVVVVIVGGLLLLPGPSQTLRTFFGPGEIPDVDFASLALTGDTDEFLACPLNVCLSTEPHAVPEEYAVPAEKLRSTLLEYVDRQSGIKLLGLDPASQQFDFSEQDPTMRLPDIITVRIIDIGGEYSTVAIYSRSVSGLGESGSNERRVRRWLSMLQAFSDKQQP